MKTIATIQEAAKEIENLLENISGSEYFYIELDGNETKIRVSDHSSNDYNNRNDNKIISFVTSKNKQKCNIRAEYLIKDGYSEEYMTIEEILDFELN